MRFVALPPVRRPVPFNRRSPTSALAMSRFFGNRPMTLYGSGTAALAAAFARCAARASHSMPEVILPAYGCPDLISACAYASVFPRLVDLSPSNWSYDFDALSEHVSSRTIAIVAVNLLGLGDGTPALAEFCRRRGLALIQDSAQFLPRKPMEWPGDYVILSFGRGKPMNLLTGGALIESVVDNVSATPTARLSVRNRLLATRAAALAFNVITRPHPYWALSHLPGLGLGRVAYKPLRDANSLPESAWRRIDSAFEQYQEQQSYSRELWESAVTEWESFGIIPLLGSTPQTPMELLRLPLLAPDRIARDAIVESLTRAHLGASRFYAADLPHLPQIPETVRCQGPFPNAEDLADKLFTLPTHNLVCEDTVQATSRLVKMSTRSKCERLVGRPSH